MMYIFYYGVWGVDLYKYYCIFAVFIFYVGMWFVYVHMRVFFLLYLLSFIENMEIF